MYQWVEINGGENVYNITMKSCRDYTDLNFSVVFLYLRRRCSVFES